MGFVHGISEASPEPEPNYAPSPTTHQAGYTGKVKIGMDVAAAEFYTAEKMYICYITFSCTPLGT